MEGTLLVQRAGGEIPGQTSLVMQLQNFTPNNMLSTLKLRRARYKFKLVA